MKNTKLVLLTFIFMLSGCGSALDSIKSLFNPQKKIPPIQLPTPTPVPPTPTPHQSEVQMNTSYYQLNSPHQSIDILFALDLQMDPTSQYALGLNIGTLINGLIQNQIDYRITFLDSSEGGLGSVPAIVIQSSDADPVASALTAIQNTGGAQSSRTNLNSISAIERAATSGNFRSFFRTGVNRIYFSLGAESSRDFYDLTLMDSEASPALWSLFSLNPVGSTQCASNFLADYSGGKNYCGLSHLSDALNDALNQATTNLSGIHFSEQIKTPEKATNVQFELEVNGAVWNSRVTADTSHFLIYFKANDLPPANAVIKLNTTVTIP